MIDFRKNPSAIPDLFIDGVRVERVTEYKYLETVLDNKLNFNTDTNFIYKKCQPRVFCLQRLRSLEVSAAVLIHSIGVALNHFKQASIQAPTSGSRTKTDQDKVTYLCQ